MPKLTGEETPGNKRLVLGFDGGCFVCGRLAHRIEERLGGKIEVLDLREPQVEEWRKKALGENAPFVPTLFEVRGTEEVRAWTGWRLAANLDRLVGPIAAWQVMQTLGEAYVAPEAGGRRSSGLTRGQFIKGVGGAAVAMSVLSVTGGLISPAEAVPKITGTATRTGDRVVGASIGHPAKWFVEREKHTFGGTYGFTLWEPGSGSSSEDYGGTPVVRVALAYALRPGQIEQKVRARMAEFPDLSLKREEVSVGEKKHKGVSIGLIPGSTPYTEVYVPVEGRVYRINVYGDKLDANGRELLSGLRFVRPLRSVDSLGLPDGRKSEEYYKKGEARLLERERAARKAARGSAATTQEAATVGPQAYGEYQTDEGCWVAASSFFFQTQHGMYANQRWGAGYVGWTQVGVPNYWGEYTHGNIGYGRCASTYYTNDMYAIDYPLDFADVIFSPFASGTVKFAGRADSHKNYGIFVVIQADNGKYVSMSAHLSGLAYGVRPGVYVTDATIIGYAGDTGDPSIPVGQPHLHQAFYRYPSYNSAGAPYGGAGLRAVYHHYVGTAAGTGPGVYEFGWTSDWDTWAKYDWISN